ncbi:Anthranilate phosphoribosyltransferase [Planctomycetales bacterium 10988]|nr:Anthranilate phosphoribosyltransferase [Planctomycetales bacterium 10988]
MIEETLVRLATGQEVSDIHVRGAIEAVMGGKCSPCEIAQLLTGLHFRGETVDHYFGAAQALRSGMTPIRTKHEIFVDTCGTGGDGSGTFNISTASAIVTAAAGVPVAKHGNRAITSRSGSSDVLAELGVNIQASLPVVEKCLDELGLCFCFAPLYHGSMKHAAEVRKRLGFPTIFNAIGPLANPASAPFQLIGVGKPHLREPLAHALLKLGCQRGMVVWGTDGLDEISCCGATEVSLVEEGKVESLRWCPRDFGVEPVPLEQLKVSNSHESATIIRELLSGEHGPAREIVSLNSAAAIWLTGKTSSLYEAVSLALKAIDSGNAYRLLQNLAHLSHQPESLSDSGGQP